MGVEYVILGGIIWAAIVLLVFRKKDKKKIKNSAGIKDINEVIYRKEETTTDEPVDHNEEETEKALVDEIKNIIDVTIEEF